MVFIDSDALIALYKKDDPHHKKALKISQKIEKDSLLAFTSWDVIDEVTTKLSFYTTKKNALFFLKETLKSSVQIIFTDPQTVFKSLAFFERQTSKRVSLTDCTNMAIAQSKGIETFFSFDKHYVKNGFKLLDQTS